MSVREIRGKRLPARGLEEPDATGADAPAVSEPEAAQPSAEQQRNRPDAKLARKRDPNRRVEEAPDERQRRQPRDQSDGYEGGEGEKDEHGRPLGDDAFESLHAARAAAREPSGEPDDGRAEAVAQVDGAFRARFGGDAPPVPESVPVSRRDAVPVVEPPPEPERPADLSSLPTAEYDLSSLQPEIRRDPPRLGVERTGVQGQIHEAVKSTLPASAPTRGEVPLDEISEPAPAPLPAPRPPPLAGVPLGASRPEASRPRALRVPPPPASTGFEALEILSQIVRGTAPDAEAPRADPPSSTTVDAIPAREVRSIDAVPTRPAFGAPEEPPPAAWPGTTPTVSILAAIAPPAARPSPVPAVTMPEVPASPVAEQKAGAYPGSSVVMTPVEEAGGAAPAPTSPTQVIPAIPSGEDEP